MRYLHTCTVQKTMVKFQFPPRYSFNSTNLNRVILNNTLYIRYNNCLSFVTHICRDVNYRWIIQYLHANGASIFFMCLFIHVGQGLYYGSYTFPETWNIRIIPTIYSNRFMCYHEAKHASKVQQSLQISFQQFLTLAPAWLNESENSQLTKPPLHDSSSTYRSIYYCSFSSCPLIIPSWYRL